MEYSEYFMLNMNKLAFLLSLFLSEESQRLLMAQESLRCQWLTFSSIAVSIIQISIHEIPMSVEWMPETARILENIEHLIWLPMSIMYFFVDAFHSSIHPNEWLDSFIKVRNKTLELVNQMWKRNNLFHWNELYLHYPLFAWWRVKSPLADHFERHCCMDAMQSSHIEWSSRNSSAGRSTEEKSYESTFMKKKKPR